MTTAYQFMRPIAFLTVKGPGLNFYKFYGPLILSVFSVGVYLLAPVKIQLVGSGSATDHMIGFFSILPGFFIASLAAIVAFQGGDLDEIMPDVSVMVVVQGESALVDITLRVFLCYLFSFLTVASFVGFFICVGGSLMAPSLLEIVMSAESPGAQSFVITVLEAGFVAVLTIVTASVVLCTAQGLYFLAERVHQKLL